MYVCVHVAALQCKIRYQKITILNYINRVNYLAPAVAAEVLFLVICVCFSVCGNCSIMGKGLQLELSSD